MLVEGKGFFLMLIGAKQRLRTRTPIGVSAYSELLSMEPKPIKYNHMGHFVSRLLNEQTVTLI